MREYRSNSTILVDIPSAPFVKDVFYASSSHRKCGMRAKTIYCFWFVPSYKGHWCRSNTIAGINCWGKETIYIDLTPRFYTFMWLPVMNLFCHVRLIT